MLQAIWLLSSDGKEIFSHSLEQNAHSRSHVLDENFLMGLKNFTQDMGSVKYQFEGDQTVIIGHLLKKTDLESYYIVGKFSKNKGKSLNAMHKILENLEKEIRKLNTKDIQNGDPVKNLLLSKIPKK